MPDKHPMRSNDDGSNEDGSITPDPERDGPVLLFDGVCNLCTASVRFVLANERGHELRFAPLHSPPAERVLANAGVVDTSALPDSMTLVDADGVHTCSGAALRLCRHLRAPWRWFAVLRIVPRPLRDAVYRVIAKHRYRVFGKSETCALPRPGDLERFLVTEATAETTTETTAGTKVETTTETTGEVAGDGSTAS